MNAYIAISKLYIKHMLQYIALARHSDGKRWYIHPDLVIPYITDASILDRELNGESFPPDVIKTIWSKAHDRGFIWINQKI